MILSAVGLPVPGPSIMNLPPPATDRAETVQPVTAAVASGGASRAAATDTGAGGTAGRQSARDEARVIRPLALQVAGAGSAAKSDRLAGPQPAFEIAVLEKLREDAMRIPPEAREPAPEAASDEPAPAAPRSETRSRDVARPTPVEGRADSAEPARDADPAADAARATDRARDADRTRDAEPPRTPDTSSAPERAAAPAGGSTRTDPTRERPRETADDGFDDARRMSEEPSPRRVDVTR
jgi:hypothetical protein